MLAAIMAAGMTPPLGIALATFIARNRFGQEERDAGKAAFVDGIGKRGRAGAPFNLDEGDKSAAPGDKVDLARFCFHPLADDLPALLGEEHRGLRLAFPAPGIGFVALFGGARHLHSPFSSNARA